MTATEATPGRPTLPLTAPASTTRAPLLLRSVYLKTLRDQRRGLVGWSIGVSLLVLVEALLWPSIRDVPDIDKLFAAYPDYLQKMFDVTSMTTGLGFLNAELFTLLLPALFLVHGIARGARLVAGEEEEGTLDVLLVTPVSGARVVLEKTAALVTDLAALAAVLWVVTVLASLAIGMGVGPGDALSGALSVFLLGAELGVLSLGVGAATGSRTVAMAVSTALATAAYVLYVAGLVVPAVDPWQRLSPFDQAIADGPLGAGLPLSFLWPALGTVVLTLLALPTLDRRDIAAPS